MDYKYKRRFLAGISVFILLVFYLFQSLSTSVRVLGFIFGLIVFYSIDYMFKLEFKIWHYYIILIILAFGILFAPLYAIYTIYDKILHFVMPILASFLVYHIADRKNLSIQWKLLITFMFMMSFLAIHEIGEYLMDLVWNMNLQGVYIRDISGIEKLNLVVSKIDDTMIDLILGMLGSFIFVVGKSIEHLIRGFRFKKK